MKFLLIVLLLAFPIGQLARLDFINRELVFHLNDLLVALTVGLWILSERKKALDLVRKSSITKPVLFWLGAVVLSLLVNLPHLSVREFLVSALYPLRWTIYFLLYFVFLSGKSKLNIRKWLIGVTLAVVISGLVQYRFLPDTVFLSAYGWDDHYYRLIGTFLDPGFTGIILVLGLLLIFDARGYLDWFRRKWRYFLVLGSSYLAMALTYSRASYLSYLAGFAVFSFYRKSAKLFLIAAVILAVTLPLLPRVHGEGTRLERENSVIGRLNNWRETVLVWTKAPVFGVGFDAYRYATKAPLTSHAGAGADSSLLFVLATTGLIGLFAYSGVLWSLWKRGNKSLLFTASLAAVLVNSWFNNTLFYPFVIEWLWILLAATD